MSCYQTGEFTVRIAGSSNLRGTIDGMKSRHWLRLFLALSAGVATAAFAPADDKKPDTATGRYEFRKDHDPDGTGKFYMGREIAQVMGHQAAGWLERPEREKEERSTKLVEVLRV